MWRRVQAGAESQHSQLGVGLEEVFLLVVLLGAAEDREAAQGPGDPPWAGAAPGDRVLRNECPLGCRTEVPVASVSLPVKREQGFPKVLLA